MGKYKSKFKISGLSNNKSNGQEGNKLENKQEAKINMSSNDIKERIRELTCKYIKENKKAKLKEIREYIRKQINQDYEWIDQAIKQVCVNYCSRVGNTTLERIKDRNCLFAVNNRQITDETYFELYNPSVHGRWELDKSSGKPYLSELPSIKKYLNWLRETYERSWKEGNEDILSNLNNLKKLIENEFFEMETYKDLCNKIPYFAHFHGNSNIARLFKERKLDKIVSIARETNDDNYNQKIEEFAKEIKNLQNEGYGGINSFITSIAHIINPEFYIPISNKIATVVVKKWWRSITERHNPTYRNKERCVGGNSDNIPCLKHFLIELVSNRINSEITSMAEIAFLLNRRKQDEKECSERQREETNNSSSQNRNTIFYGPPGTGKTFSVRRRAVEIVEKNREEENIEERFKKLLFSPENNKDWRIAFITFHPSTSYETFMEGIWAETDENGNIRYKVKDGIFKVVTYYALWHALEDSERQGGFEDYEDMKRKVQENLRKHFEGNSKFNFETAENIVLIIDEINRGNIPSIFGELITLIEDTKRLGEREELSLILPYSGEIFSVPKNLYIIGTMNTADRSIVLLDTALRRRFNFEEFLPDETLLEGISVENLELKPFLSKLNNKIKEKKGKDFMIGHAYFLSLRNIPEERKLDEFIKILSNKVLPLLQEYFYDDWETLIEILGGEEGGERVERYLINRYGEIKYSEMNSNKEEVIDILLNFTNNSRSEETVEGENVSSNN